MTFVRSLLPFRKLRFLSNVAKAAFLLLIFTSPRTDASQAFITEGIGSTCADALKQAKSLAIENATGSYVISKKSLTADKYYDESLTEFSGGVVTSFHIIKSDGEQPCLVRIYAEINIDSTSRELLTKENRIDLGEIGAYAENRLDGQSIIEKLLNNPEHFNVETSDVYINTNSESTQIDFKISKITFSKSLKSDLEALLSIQEKPMVYEKPGWKSFGKGLFTLLSLPIKIPTAIFIPNLFSEEQRDKRRYSGSGLCFRERMDEKINCYHGPLSEYLATKLQLMKYKVILTNEQDKASTLFAERNISLLSEYYSPVRLQTEESSEGRQQFILAEYPDIIQNESITLSTKLLKPGLVLNVIVVN